jgi:PAS domain S-box-containing protein
MKILSKSHSFLEQNLELVLIGAAKVLGCNSATLLVIDEKKNTVRLSVATLSDQVKGLDKARDILGFEPRGATVPIELVSESIILKSFRGKKILETSRISDLVGSTLVSSEATNILESLIRKIRFSCVPVIGRSDVEAVILFSKMDDRPFTFRQRQLQLEYAKRLGLIIGSEKFSEEIYAFRKKWLTDSDLLPASLRRVLDMETDAMLSLDGAQTIVAVNPRAEEMFAARGEDLVGRPFEVLFEEEEGPEQVLACRLKLMSDGHMETEALMRRFSGEGMRALMTGVLALDGEGKGAGALIHIREIPGEARDSQIDLHERLMKSERLAMIGEMASQMAHEIRNPLVSIGAALRVIREDMADDAPVQEELDSILDEVDRLDAIIRDYLSLAKRSAGRVERVRLEDVLREAAKVVAINPACSGVEIRVRSNHACHVMGDFDALKQVFINLLLNAVEASSEGGIVEGVIDRVAHEARVRVLDRGEGLSDKKRERLFEPFFTTKSKGSGLGLSISKNIVEEMEGEITIHEREGGGCEALVKFRAFPE